ncbi:MAG: hypothetical protein A2Y15_00095 [Clostridiales bacterium GWF2_36_10]|nr:MAG: hypothetical protein A2Y15_00095 [Clostridiales bacterium GWF2_36_10]
MRVILIGIIIGPSIMLISSILLAFVALKTGNPTGSVFPLALFAIFLGGLISSLRSAKTYTEKPAQAGLLTGLANLVIVTIVALISSTYSGGLWNAVLPPAILAASSLFGTFIATKMKQNTKRKLKKLRRQIR